MAKALFVTASGTDIGKTYVACAILRAWVRAGASPRAIKPVLSGYDPHDWQNNDTAHLLKASNKDVGPERIAASTPWRFRAPISPDMAASREGRSIPFDDVQAFCQMAQKAANQTHLLVEGAGGVLAPLTHRHTNRDLIAALGWPTILVGGTYLGSISHTLTAYEALKPHVPQVTIILSESQTSPVPPEETLEAVRRLSANAPIALIRRNTDAPPEMMALIER